MESRNSLASSEQNVRKVSAAPIQFFLWFSDIFGSLTSLSRSQEPMIWIHQESFHALHWSSHTCEHECFIQLLFIMNVRSSCIKFMTPFCHILPVHIITTNTNNFTMKFSWSFSFLVEKSNNTMLFNISTNNCTYNFTQHDMLPQHVVCKYELNCEYCNITLAGDKAPWWWSDKIETCRSVLKCFMWNYMCIRWLINWSDSTKMHGATIRFKTQYTSHLVGFGFDTSTLNLHNT